MLRHWLSQRLAARREVTERRREIVRRFNARDDFDADWERMNRTYICDRELAVPPDGMTRLP